MKNFFSLKWVFALHILLFLTGCEKDIIEPAITVSPSQKDSVATIHHEGFESGTKTSYAGASVALTDGSWYLLDALIGTSTSDLKYGTKAARLQNSGKLTMQFDYPEGAKSLSLYYGKFGKDSNTSFEVYYSTNAGSTWTMAGSRITAGSTTLQKTTLSLNVSGPVRFEIRKVDGTSNRLNLDDISVEANPAAVAAAVQEDYEAGSKGSYAAGSVVLTSGNWYLKEALIGTLDADRKTGLKSVRIRDLGTLEMQFDVQGAQSVSLNHAVYGTDASSTWELQASTNGGSTWVKQGNTITSTTTLQNVTFTVNFTSGVRFRIVKTSGSGNRINIDDFIINGSTGGSTDGGETGGNTGGDTTSTTGSLHLSLGNPSFAVADVNQPNNYLLKKDEYAMSYSRDRGTANWVSWHLDEVWLGSTPRQDDFRSDNTLPAGWYQVGSTDYSGSGFDRGHMCPSADRTLSVDDNSKSFLMTNMIPQAPNNNQLGWASLENYCRSMLTGGYEIYIISGGYGVGGAGSNGYTTTIANGKVTVPSNTWKVIVIIPDGDNDAARVTSGTRVIAVDMPNNQTVTSDWRKYRTTIDNIEAKTGYDFLSLINDNVESVLESKIDTL